MDNASSHDAKVSLLSPNGGSQVGVVQDSANMVQNEQEKLIDNTYIYSFFIIFNL